MTKPDKLTVNNQKEKAYIPVLSDDCKTIVGWVEYSKEYIGRTPEEEDYDHTR